MPIDRMQAALERRRKRAKGSITSAMGEEFMAGVGAIGDAFDPFSNAGMMERVLGAASGPFQALAAPVAPVMRAMQNALPAMAGRDIESAGLTADPSIVTASLEAGSNPISGPARRRSGDPGVDMAVDVIGALMPAEAVGLFSLNLLNKGRGAALRMLRKSFDMPTAEQAQKVLAAAGNDTKVATGLMDDTVDFAKPDDIEPVLPARGLSDEVSYGPAPNDVPAIKAAERAELMKTRIGRRVEVRQKFYEQQAAEAAKQQDDAAAALWAERAAATTTEQGQKLLQAAPAPGLNLPGGGMMLDDIAARAARHTGRMSGIKAKIESPAAVTSFERDMDTIFKQTGVEAYADLAKAEDAALARVKPSTEANVAKRQAVDTKRAVELATAEPRKADYDAMLLRADASASVRARTPRDEARVPRGKKPKSPVEPPLPPAEVAALEAKLPNELKPADYVTLRRQIKSVMGDDDLKSIAAKVLGEGRSGPRTQAEAAQIKDYLLDFSAKAGRDPASLLPATSPIVDASSVLKEPPGIWKHAWNGTSSGFIETGRAFLSRQGRAGKALASLIDTKESLWRMRAGQAFHELDTVTADFTPDQLSAFRKALDLGEATSDPRVQAAVDITRNRLKDLYTEFGAMGGKVSTETGAKIPAADRAMQHYYPHMIDLKKARPHGKVAKTLAKAIADQRGILESDAEVLIRQYIGRHAVRRFGNLEHARELNLPEAFYHTENPTAVLKLYYARAYDRLEEMRHFGLTPITDPATGRIASFQPTGPNREAALQLVNQISAEGGDAVYSRKILDQIMGTTEINRAAEFVSRNLMAWQIMTKMSPLSSIMNASQFALTAHRTNMRVFLKTMKEFRFKDEAIKALALESGATLDRHLADVMRVMGAPTQALGDQLSAVMGSVGEGRLGDVASFYLRNVGFGLAENFDRTFSALAGKNYIQDLTAQLRSGNAKTIHRARYDLGRLKYGEDDIARLTADGPNKDDILRAAQTITDDTQFYQTAMNLPRHFMSPGGKVLLQFKSFMHQTSRLLINELHHSWKKDPASFAKTMGTWLLFLPAVAEGALDVKALFRTTGGSLANALARGVGLEEAKLDTKRTLGGEADLAVRYWRDLTSIAAFGVLGDAVEAIRFGDYGVTNFLAGPTGQNVMESAQLVGQPTETRARRLAQKNIPVAAPWLTGPRKRRSSAPMYPFN